MIKQKYIKTTQDIYVAALGIMMNRVDKYANDTNPFQNFMDSADFAGTTVAEGILTRIGDKFSRLKNTIARRTEGQFQDEYTDESLLDTVKDIANYTCILYMWIAWGESQYVYGNVPEETEVNLPPTTIPVPEKKSGLLALFS